MRNPNTSAGLAVAISLLALAGAASASESPPPTPVAETQELDEIWVRGEHLSRVIEEAEDDFFELYNKLNKNADYDVHCGQMALNSDSMIMVRSCVPGFLVYNYYSAATGTVRLGQQCNGVQAFRETNGDWYYTSSCFPQASSTYEPPPAELLAMARRPAYQKNVMKVVGSDERLLAKVRNLAGLYDEMELTQQHYSRIRQATQPSSPGRKPVRPYPGPRIM